jgi:hypothetical protein
VVVMGLDYITMSECLTVVVVVLGLDHHRVGLFRHARHPLSTHEHLFDRRRPSSPSRKSDATGLTSGTTEPLMGKVRTYIIRRE